MTEQPLGIRKVLCMKAATVDLFGKRNLSSLHDESGEIAEGECVVFLLRHSWATPNIDSHRSALTLPLQSRREAIVCAE